MPFKHQILMPVVAAVLLWRGFTNAALATVVVYQVGVNLWGYLYPTTPKRPVEATAESTARAALRARSRQSKIYTQS